MLFCEGLCKLRCCGATARFYLGEAILLQRECGSLTLRLNRLDKKVPEWRLSEKAENNSLAIRGTAQEDFSIVL